MKNVLKAFGSTLDQVCTAVRDRFGDEGVSDDAQHLSVSLAVAKAADRGPGHATVGKWILASTLAASAALSQSPAFAESSNNDGRGEGNTAARVVGGVGGAVIGAALTHGSGALAKTAVVLGLGYLGQTIGDIMTRKAVDQNGNPVVEVGKDAQGRPIYQPLVSSAPRPGTAQMPQRITAEVYEGAVARAASATPEPALTGVNGFQYRALDIQTHTGLYALMVETAATRALAKLANNDLDSAELARAVNPTNQKKAAEFSVANQAYTHLFRAYATSYQQTSQALAIAERNGFDVSSQKLLMSIVPGDIRIPTGSPIHWPGVDNRIRELGAEMHIDPTSTFADISANGQRLTQVDRPRSN